MIDTVTEKNIQSWLDGDYDAATKAQILTLQKENPDELLNAFYSHLEFGTGGLRGLMGVGTNRMNPYTVRAATQGLAHYIRLQNPSASVLIGYDCRLHSREFAEEAAKVLLGNEIEVFLYHDLHPVPLVSFGVRYKKCLAGIMITASHNPASYNGYKVYWSDGAQVLPPHDVGIMEEVKKITLPSQVKIGFLSSPLFHEVASEIDEAYLKATSLLQQQPVINKAQGSELKIIYTPLHGTGITLVPPMLKSWGFTSLSIVEEQRIPNGHFPTISAPNPEVHAAMNLGIEKLNQLQGDLLIGTDADADRIGLVVRHEGKPFFFDGNQTACLLLEHLGTSLTQNKKMPPHPICVKTIVTTELFKAIAEAYGMACLDVLPGFKYIGEKMTQWEHEKEVTGTSPSFIFGGEESYGYLLGTHVRDKDGIISAACASEAALQMKLKGKTLVDLLFDIYRRYGVYRETLLSLNFEGKEGADKMVTLMSRLRKTPPTHLDKLPIVSREDYLTGLIHTSNSSTPQKLTLPKSDVLRFWLEDGTKLIIRPSGTEPKIKIYLAVRKLKPTQIPQAIQACDERLRELTQTVKNFF